MSQVSLVELLEAGAHFGHRTDKWHPAAKPYIYGIRNGVHIIDLEKSAQALEDAQNYIENQVAAGKSVLMVCTKRQGRDLVQKAAEESGASFITERWIGGTLTNFAHIHKLSQKLAQLEKDMVAGNFDKYTKKEKLSFAREIERLKEIVGGLSSLTKLPDVVFLVDLKKNVTALKESLIMKIPVVAMVDTNVDPRDIAYPIPCNDDATKAIALVVRHIGEAIARGNKRKADDATKLAAQNPAPVVAQIPKEQPVPLMV